MFLLHSFKNKIILGRDHFHSYKTQLVYKVSVSASPGIEFEIRTT